MKINHLVPILGVVASICVATACSTSRGPSTGADLSASGPTVVSVQSKPSTIELTRELAPTEPGASVVAEVKDFTSAVSEVNLRFINVPLSIPMTYLGGTTWQAQLTPEQLKILAVGGRTMSYAANVIARNEEGQTAVSSEPVTVAVKTPDLTDRRG
jgi:hypothetical protein